MVTLRRSRPPGLALAVLLTATLACNDSFTPQYRVDDLRILSIRSEAPPGSLLADAAPGTTAVRLAALVVNPRHRTPVRYQWIACLPEGGEGLPPCLDPAWLRQPDRLAGAPGALVFAEGEGLDVVELSLPDLGAALEAVAALAEAQPAYACRPYAELTVVLVVEADGERQVAVKGIRISATEDPSEYVLNGNPAVQELRLHPTVDEGCDGLLVATECDSDSDCPGATCVGAGDGRRGRCDGPETPLPGGTFDLCAWPDWRKIQRYDVCAPDGSRSPEHETPSWQWYVSAGTLEPANAVGNATGERVTVVRDGDGPFTIWILLHDGRGGEGWMRYDVR
jgi:hypothetical protein